MLDKIARVLIIVNVKEKKQLRIFTRPWLLVEMQNQVHAAGGIRRWAAQHGVNAGTVSKAHRGMAELTSGDVLRALGVEVVYREVEK